MNIEIHFTKKAVLVVAGVVLCGLIGLGCWYNSAFKARQTLRAECQGNCDCFNNVVDYRLTNEQVRLFARFMKELQVRKDANVLEFMDTLTATNIQKAFSVCQQQAVEPTPAPKEAEQPVAQPKNKKK